MKMRSVENILQAFVDCLNILLSHQVLMFALVLVMEILQEKSVGKRDRELKGEQKRTTTTTTTTTTTLKIKMKRKKK
jgi:hypothetical protein